MMTDEQLSLNLNSVARDQFPEWPGAKATVTFRFENVDELCAKGEPRLLQQTLIWKDGGSMTPAQFIHEVRESFLDMFSDPYADWGPR